MSSDEQDAAARRATEVASSAASTATAAANEDVAGAASGLTDAATSAAPEMPAEATAALETASAATSMATASTPTAAASGAIGAVDATGLAPAGTPQVAQSVLSAAGNIPAAPSSPSPSSSATPTTTSSAAPTVASTSQAVLSMFTGTPEPVTISFEAPSVTASVWTASSLNLQETLSAPYVASVTLSTDDLDADETLLLGASVTIHLRRGTLERDVSGIVEEVTTEDAPSEEAHTKKCHVRVVPALSLLGYRRNTRMFWDKDIVEILKDVLEKSLSEFDRTVEFKTERVLPKCEYRMQYDESDLAFAQRLIGEEGLYYFFTDKDGKEILIVADDASKYPKLVGEDADRVPYASNDNSDGHEAVTGFRRMDVVRPNKISLQHWDWTKAKLQNSEAAANSDAAYPDPVGLTLTGNREVYEHDSRQITFDEYSDGSGYGTNDTVEQAKIRRQQFVQSGRHYMGDSTCTGLAVGTVFELTKHPDGALDQEYVVIAIGHSAHVGDAAQASGAVAELEATYANHFTCVPAALTYRAPRPADKPRVRGIVTALVVGEGKPEIYTDSLGRVKVQFHWDRESGMDAKGACFIRVAQMMAGQGWGSFFLPRVGMEVIVQFLDGDPDRPLITGCVYNGQNGTPYPLPDEATKSGFISRSSEGGGEEDFNELTFEDKKGEEQIILHAQKDLNENVENNHSTTVGASQTNSVGGDRSVSVSGKQTVSVTKDESYTVQGTESFSVTGLVTETFDGGRTTTIKGDDVHTVNGGKKDVTIHGEYNILADTHVSMTQNGKSTLKVHESASWDANGQIVIKVGSNSIAVDKGGSIVIDAASEMTLVCGGAGISLKKDGTVTISGSLKTEIGGGAGSIVLDSSGAQMGGPAATVSAQSNLSLSGAMVDMAGKSMTTITGAIVKIN